MNKMLFVLVRVVRGKKGFSDEIFMYQKQIGTQRSMKMASKHSQAGAWE